MSKFSSIERVWSYLDQIPMFSKVGASASKFGLGSIRDFCQQIGNPQDQIQTIHVAGTNGKGTVTLLLEALYRNAGFKTGAFTSPHLLKYNERVNIAGDAISDEKILEFFQSFEKKLEDAALTYFEISTALAFWAFADAKVDIAIIETGLGGRLDSTNIITPKCAVLTSIGLDHQAILGNSVEEIAKEKAGIIKRKVPVVIGNIEGKALHPITHKAKDEHAPLFYSKDQNPSFDQRVVRLSSVSKELKTQFIEPVNAWNVAIAKTVIEILKTDFPISNYQFISGIEAFKGVPARFEQLLPNTDWFFSGAHNPDALQNLAEVLQQFKGRKITCVLSMMKDKLSPDSVQPFQAYAAVYFYEQEGNRAAKLEDISAFLSVNSINETNVERILEELKQEVVIFAGSFYFYAIVKRWLTHLN